MLSDVSQDRTGLQLAARQLPDVASDEGLCLGALGVKFAAGADGPRAAAGVGSSLGAEYAAAAVESTSIDKVVIPNSDYYPTLDPEYRPLDDRRDNHLKSTDAGAKPGPLGPYPHRIRIWFDISKRNRRRFLSGPPGQLRRPILVNFAGDEVVNPPDPAKWKSGPHKEDAGAPNSNEKDPKKKDFEADPAKLCYYVHSVFAAGRPQHMRFLFDVLRENRKAYLQTLSFEELANRPLLIRVLDGISQLAVSTYKKITGKRATTQNLDSRIYMSVYRRGVNENGMFVDFDMHRIPRKLLLSGKVKPIHRLEFGGDMKPEIAEKSIAAYQLEVGGALSLKLEKWTYHRAWLKRTAGAPFLSSSRQVS
eukprot:tig00000113_g5662.t1